MKLKLYDETGGIKGEASLSDDIFALEPKKMLIRQVIEAEKSNRRQGTHKTKVRSEVSGGGKKPWKQKGTGNARQGSTRSPQWRGGGVSFGPQPRSYRVDLPKKLKKAGLRSVLSAKAKEGSIRVLQDIHIKSYSTKKVYKVFQDMKLIPKSTVVYVAKDTDQVLEKSFANIKNIKLLNAKRLTVPEILYAGSLVLAESAIPIIEESLCPLKKKDE